jgi:hypothetical protein
LDEEWFLVAAVKEHSNSSEVGNDLLLRKAPLRCHMKVAVLEDSGQTRPQNLRQVRLPVLAFYA